MRLTCRSNSASGLMIAFASRLARSTRRSLLANFASWKALRNSGSSRHSQQLRQFEQIGAPCRPESLVDQRRTRLREPASRRDAVGHVGKALGEHAREVGGDILHHQLRMQLRYAVHLVTRDDRQMRTRRWPYSSTSEMRRISSTSRPNFSVTCLKNCALISKQIVTIHEQAH